MHYLLGKNNLELAHCKNNSAGIISNTWRSDLSATLCAFVCGHNFYIINELMIKKKSSTAAFLYELQVTLDLCDFDLRVFAYMRLKKYYNLFYLHVLFAYTRFCPIAFSK